MLKICKVYVYVVWNWNTFSFLIRCALPLGELKAVYNHWPALRQALNLRSPISRRHSFSLSRRAHVCVWFAPLSIMDQTVSSRTAGSDPHEIKCVCERTRRPTSNEFIWPTRRCHVPIAAGFHLYYAPSALHFVKSDDDLFSARTHSQQDQQTSVQVTRTHVKLTGAECVGGFLCQIAKWIVVLRRLIVYLGLHWVNICQKSCFKLLTIFILKKWTLKKYFYYDKLAYFIEWICFIKSDYKKWPI